MSDNRSGIQVMMEEEVVVVVVVVGCDNGSKIRGRMDGKKMEDDNPREEDRRREFILGGSRIKKRNSKCISYVYGRRRERKREGEGLSYMDYSQIGIDYRLFLFGNRV